MGQSPAIAPTETNSDEPSPAPPRSLFEVMRQGTTAKSDTPEKFDESERVDERTGSPSETLAATQPPSDVVIDDQRLSLNSIDDPKLSRAAISASRFRQGRVGLACGVASVGLSVLASRPEVWMSIPASILGFASIILGYLTLAGSRRHRVTPFAKMASAASLLLGVLGVFLGPLFFAGMGRELRESSGHDLTRQHLISLGIALNRYHDQRGAFPIGGTFVRQKSGEFKGQHGWMTFLLPFVGEQSLFQQIDQTKPFDVAVNREPMGREVVVYYAAGGDRSKIGQGFAVSHFAGVGGDIEDETGLSHAGIFMREAAIRREDVKDGLANTLIVGELPGNYPPWGDPENWRTIGRGLNKDVDGFGNATGNGALFLFADGSVKAFNNKTDLKLLRQLSTRDGGEQSR